MFRFKQFSVRHAQSLLKVGTDAVVLGSLLEAPAGSTRALDIGTGCGVIALMVAQRFPDLHIDALEPDEKSAEEAMLNFQHAPFASRLQCIAGRLQEYHTDASYDLIFSNPPYFEVPMFERGNNPQRMGAGRKEAATQSTLTFADVWAMVPGLLKNEGTFWVILPADATKVFTTLANASGFFLQHHIAVHSKETTEPIRSVLGYGRTAAPLNQWKLVLYNEDGSRHPLYQELTREFYL